MAVGKDLSYTSLVGVDVSVTPYGQNLSKLQMLIYFSLTVLLLEIYVTDVLANK